MCGVQVRNSSNADARRIEAELAALIEASPVEREALLRDLCARDPAVGEEAERWLGWLEHRGLVFVDHPIPSTLGEFRLIERVGGGGMGVVFRAHQPSLGRDVALKILRPELLYLERARERFQAEGRAVASLSHPNIVPVYAVGEDRGVPYLAMEWIDGVSLAEALAALGEVDVAHLDGDSLRVAAGVLAGGDGLFRASWETTAASVAHEVATALDHAHSRGVVHRDVKPSNIMLGRDGRVVLLDFGLARVEDGLELTRTSDRPGSLPYMAPEQIDRGAIDERTDVYSLGVTLYQLLTLHLPFPVTTAEATERRVREGVAMRPARRNRKLSWEAEVVCQTAMDVDPRRRYASARAFCDDLQALVANRPISAKPPSFGRRVIRGIQRRPALVLGSVLAAIVFFVLPTTLYILSRNANARVVAQKRVADDSFHSALNAVNGLVARLSQSEIRASSAAARDRVAAFYREATAFYEKWLPRRPDDRRLMLSAAIGWRQLAGCHEILGQVEESLKANANAIKALDRAVRSGGSSLLSLDLRVSAHLAMYRLLSNLGRPRAAREHLSVAAQEGRRAMAVAPNKAARIDAKRAYALVMIANFDELVSDGKHAEATKTGGQLRSLLAELGDEAGDEKHRRVLLALRVRLGVLSMRRNEEKPAEAHFSSAVQLARKIGKPAVAPAFVQSNLARALYYLGVIEGYRRRHAAAGSKFDEALALQRELMTESPGDSQLRSRTIEMLRGAVKVYRVRRQFALARPYLDELIKLAGEHGLRVLSPRSHQLVLFAHRLRYADQRYHEPELAKSLLAQMVDRMNELPEQEWWRADLHRETSECLLVLADDYLGAGKLDLAQRSLTDATARFEKWEEVRSAEEASVADKILHLRLRTYGARLLLARGEGASALAILDSLAADSRPIPRSSLRSTAVLMDESRAWALAACGRVPEAVKLSQASLRPLAASLRRLPEAGRAIVLTGHPVFEIAKYAARSKDAQHRDIARKFVSSFGRLTKRFAGEPAKARLLTRLKSLERLLSAPR